jgi:hypothetical protein
LRYHSSNNVADLPDTDDKFDFHNMLVSPGITAYDNSNPGVTTFEITEDLIPHNLRMEFLNLKDTIGKPAGYTNLKWNPVDFAKMWNLK